MRRRAGLEGAYSALPSSVLYQQAGNSQLSRTRSLYCNYSLSLVPSDEPEPHSTLPNRVYYRRILLQCGHVTDSLLIYILRLRVPNYALRGEGLAVRIVVAGSPPKPRCLECSQMGRVSLVSTSILSTLSSASHACQLGFQFEWSFGSVETSLSIANPEVGRERPETSAILVASNCRVQHRAARFVPFPRTKAVPSELSTVIMFNTSIRHRQ